MCVLSIEVPIRKNSGNLLNGPRLLPILFQDIGLRVSYVYR